MQKSSTIIIFSLVSLFLFSNCKKKDTETQRSELDKLPAITQTGKKSFGFLLNGQAWLPQGSTGTTFPTPNYEIFLDPSYRDGDISIRVYKIDKAKNLNESFSINSDSVRGVGTYFYRPNGRLLFRYTKDAADFSVSYCDTYVPSGLSTTGFLNINRYDLIAGIVSGEFQVSFACPSCGLGDSVKITNGRFDYKFY